MKVVIVGAAGYVGFGIAQAFRRDGWTVYGIVRNEEQAKKIREKEIIPLVNDYKSIKDFEAPHWTFDWNSVEVVIDSTGMHDSTFLEILRGYPKKTLIYNSGILVYGHSEDVIADENTPARPTAILKRVNDLEKQILSDDKVNGIIIRPGWVFGGCCGKNVAPFWNPENPIKGTEQTRWSWVHVDDLGQGFLLAAKHRYGNASKQIFNMAVNHSPTWKELRTTMIRAAGHKDELVFTGLTEADKGTFPETMFQTVVVSSRKAEDLLGWNPRFRTFLGDIELYYQSHLASKK